MTGPFAIEVSHLAKSYDQVRAIDDISFQVAGGDCAGVRPASIPAAMKSGQSGALAPHTGASPGFQR